MITGFYNTAASLPLYLAGHQIFKVHFHWHTSAAGAWFYVKIQAALLWATVLLTVLSGQRWETETGLQ